jgi:enamine deaminase RidA (YjgF/YER057c/UK114 family)
VIRTRIYVVHMDQWRDVARAHGEFFGDIRPANTLIAVKALVDPGHLVEIEADALIQDHWDEA